MTAREPADELAMASDKRDLVLRASQTLIAHHQAGRIVDPESLAWAESVVAIEGSRPQEVQRHGVCQATTQQPRDVAWAHRLMQRVSDGERIPKAQIEMAQNAIRKGRQA